MMTQPLPGPPGVLSPTTDRSQDEVEFEALFLAHYDGIYRLLYRIVGSPQAAEDLAQETFLRLHRQRFAADREHNVRAWLYRVATNLAYNELRGQKRRERRQELVADEENLAPNPEEAVLRRAEQAVVRQTLAKLPERQAQLLLLRHAGLSYRELAEAVGVAPGSVGTLLARAHQAFETAYGTVAIPPPGRRHGHQAQEDPV